MNTRISRVFLFVFAAFIAVVALAAITPTVDAHTNIPVAPGGGEEVPDEEEICLIPPGWEDAFEQYERAWGVGPICFGGGCDPDDGEDDETPETPTAIIIDENGETFFVGGCSSGDCRPEEIEIPEEGEVWISIIPTLEGKTNISMVSNKANAELWVQDEDGKIEKIQPFTDDDIKASMAFKVHQYWILKETPEGFDFQADFMANENYRDHLFEHGLKTKTQPCSLWPEVSVYFADGQTCLYEGMNRDNLWTAVKQDQNLGDEHDNDLMTWVNTVPTCSSGTTVPMFSTGQ